MTGLSKMESLAPAIKEIHIQVPMGVPTQDGGLEIPNRVFLGGVPAETTEMELEIFFTDFGAVKDVRIVTDRMTGECKGYGFVTFEENQDVTELIKRKSVLMKGKKVRVRKAIRRNGSQFASNTSSKKFPIETTKPTENPYYLLPVTEGLSQQPQKIPSPCYIPFNSPAVQSPPAMNNSPPMIPPPHTFQPPLVPSCSAPIYYFNPSMYAPYPPMPQWPIFQA